ncbi:hypothetical protein C817_04734 [Dorea sp. 5-2]|nr:hypothetical protein C817_04734 [Dorea sp. 5-2]
MKKGSKRLRQILAAAVAVILLGSSMNVPSARSFAKEPSETKDADLTANGESKDISAEEVKKEEVKKEEVKTEEKMPGEDPERQAETEPGKEEEAADQAEPVDETQPKEQDGLPAKEAQEPEAETLEEQPVEEEQMVEETVDLSDYIFQYGGLRVMDEPAPANVQEGRSADRAAADIEGAKSALLQGLNARQESISLTAYKIPAADLKGLIVDVLNANPRLFYVGGEYTYYLDSDGSVKEIEPVYNSYTAANVQAYDAALDKAFREAVPNASGMSQAEVARACHDYLAQHMYYDFTYSKSNAYNALVEGTAVCQGYSLAYGAMLQKAGIAFDYTTSEAMNHMWNYVQIDGAWYHVDVTWDDPTVQEVKAPSDRKGSVQHRYFLNSDKKIGSEGDRGHRGWVQRQNCTAETYDNAYWQSNISAIFKVAGKDYYLKYPDSNSTTIELVSRENGQETVLDSFTAEWKATEGQRWLSLYSSLSYYNNKLYFNDAKNIYCFNPNIAGAIKKQIYQYTEGAGDLYGSLVCDDKIMMTVATTPLEVGTIKEEKLPTGSIQGVTVTVNPASAEYGYSTAPVMTAAVVKQDGETGTEEYAWYRVKENGAAEKLVSTSDSCPVESGLQAGTYTYRVIVTLGDDTLSRDAAFTVTPKTITPAVTILNEASYTYQEGTPVIPQFTVTADGVTLGKDVDYTVSYENNVNAGEGRVVISPVAGRNYTWDMPVSAAFTINKADKEMDQRTSQARYGSQGTVALELPAGAVLGAVSVSDPDTVLAGTPSVANGSLSYTFVNDEGKVGKKAVITVPVTFADNYNPYDIKVTALVTDKEIQADFRFVTSPENRTYGEADFTAAVTGAADGSQITYRIEDTQIAEIDPAGKVHIKKAGTTKIIAAASETSEYAQTVISCELNVKKAQLSWTDLEELYAADRADNETRDKKTTAEATLYGRLKVAGIVEGDDVTFDCTADKLVGTYAKVDAGDQDVTLSWKGVPVTLTGADAENYMLPESLPTIRGKITKIIVQAVEIEGEDGTKFQLEIETGITEVPASLEKNEKWNTILKINNGMKAELSEIMKGIKDENKVVYDVKLMVNTDGKGWVEATKENFPKDGLTVTIPYPEGTGKDSHNFAAAHLFTTAMNGFEAGETERMESSKITKTEDGVRFTVHGLSPIALGWEEIAKSAGNPVTGDNRNTTSGSRAPRTGDENSVLLYALLMMMSAAAVGSIKRRSHKNT